MVQNIIFWLLLFVSPAIYWLLKPSIRLYFLALVSLGFVLYLDPYSALLLLALGVGLYLLLPVIAGGDRRGFIAVSVVLTALIGSIAYNKYIPLILSEVTKGSVSAVDLIVPLGMSYYIFKMIHVAVDAYRRRAFDAPPAEFFCYLFLFTIFSAGPIQRADSFLKDQQREFHSRLLVEGFTRIAFGFVKQFFVIDLIIMELRFRLLRGVEYDLGFAENLDLSTGELWLNLLFVYVIGYLNFSAYTDIAIGGSRLFGFRISENFNFPIIARNIGEFWQRWHMTLAAWAQAYVYSPVLGVTRNPYVAIYASFAMIGIWHAGTLNRLAWGLFHASGVLIMARWSRYARRRKITLGASIPGQAIGWVLTQGFVVAGMVFVIGEYQNDLVTAGRLFLKLFGINL